MTGNGIRTVLIVDDDEDVRDALRLLFEFEGYEVVGEAPSGLQAVGPAIEHQPDFIILDYLMPEMNGNRAAEMLRGVAPDTRIVAFSAILEAKPKWADAYLNKSRIGDIAPLLKELI
jgi:two-component system chemotaxis response regulator CheY